MAPQPHDALQRLHLDRRLAQAALARQTCADRLGDVGIVDGGGGFAIQSGPRLARLLLGHVGLALRLHGSGLAAGHLGFERRGVVRAEPVVVAATAGGQPARQHRRGQQRAEGRGVERGFHEWWLSVVWVGLSGRG